jgi:hypothetical protein
MFFHLFRSLFGLHPKIHSTQLDSGHKTSSAAGARHMIEGIHSEEQITSA